MSKLTTHVLDLSHGCPAGGMRVELYRLHTDEKGTVTRQLAASDVTNRDGRCDQPLVEGDQFKRGHYEIVFAAGAYLDHQGDTQCEPKFLDDIVIRFGIADPQQHYHVPLLLSRFGYSTYRGS